MANSLGDLTVRIGADDSSFKNTMTSVGDRLKTFADDALSISVKLAEGVTAVIGAATAIDKIWGTSLIETIRSGALSGFEALKTGASEMATSVSASASEMSASVSASFESAKASVTEFAASEEAMGATAAASAVAVGVAAESAAASVAATGAAATASTGAFAGLAGAAGIGAVIGGLAVLTVGAAAGAVAILALAQATDREITSQEILAQQLGTTFQNVATFQNAGQSLGVGNGLLDLLGGSNLQAVLDKLSTIASGSGPLSSAASASFQNTSGGVEQLVAAFKDLADPIDRADLAVQLFGQNAAKALALMTPATVDAVNSANALATGWDVATRESIQRITEYGDFIKSTLLAPFDFSTMWAQLKQGVLTGLAAIEQPVHDWFAAFGSAIQKDLGTIQQWLDSHGLTIPIPSAIAGLGGMSDLQMQQIMKTATANVGTPGSPFSIPSAASQVPNQLAAAQALIDANNAEGLSYADLSSHVSSLTTSLAAMETQFAANKLNPALTDQNILLADAIVNTQGLIDKDQGLIDKADATAASIKALAGAYATLGITNFSSLLKGATDDSGNVTQLSGLAAFSALADKLSSPQLVQAADNLEAKLQEAFHQGAMSADDFNAAVDKIEAKVAELGDAWTLITKKFAGFDMAAEIAPLAAELRTINDEMQRSGALAGDWALKLIAAESSMKQFMDATGTVFAVKLDSTPLIDALNKLQTGSKQAIAEFDLVAQAGGTSLTEIEDDWARVSGAINKIAKVDLPGAIEQYNILIAAVTKRKAAEGELLAFQQQLLNLEIKNKDLTGADATAEIIALTQKTYETKALKDAAEGLGQVYVGLRKTFDDAFASLSKGIADAIVNSKNLGDVFVNVSKQIATSILDTIIKGALVPLQDELNKTGGLFDTLAKSATSAVSKIPGFSSLGGGPNANTPTFDPVTGASIPAGAGGAWTVTGPSSSVPGTTGSGETASEGIGGPGGTVQSGPNVGSGEVGGTTSGSSGGGASSLLSSVAGVAGIVSAVSSVLSGIVQGVQMAHLESLTDKIEKSTRGMLNVLATNGADSVLDYTKHTWMDLEQVLTELSNLHDDNVAILGKFDDLLNAGFGGGGGGGGGTGAGLNSGQVIDLLQRLQTGVVVPAFGPPISNPLYPPAEVALANTALTDLTTITTGATTAVTDASTALATFSTTTTDAVAATKKAADITATLSTAQQAQVALVDTSLTKFASDAHDLLATAGSEALSSQQAFALAWESANNLTIAQRSLTAAEYAAAQTIAQQAAAEASFSDGMKQVAQSLSLLPPAIVAVQQATTRLASPYANAVPQTGPGGTGTYADILRLTGGTGNVGLTLVNAQAALAGDLASNRTDSAAVAEENRLRQLIFDLSKYTSNVASWGDQMPSAGIDPGSYQMPSYPSSPPIPSNPYTGGSSVFSPIPPPSTPVNSFGSHSLTVNALSPSAKGVGDALIQYLRSNGVRV